MSARRRIKLPIYAALQIAGCYAVASVLWILCSDGILWFLVQDASVVAAMQTTKGILFVVSSAALIYVLTHRALSRVADTEEQRAKNESRLRAIMRVSGIGTWEDNCGHAPDYLSPQMYSILGYDPLPVGQGFAFLASLRHPEDSEGVARAFEALGTPGNDDCLHIFRMRHRDGDYRWIECRAHVTARDDHGRPERILGSHTDISTLRQAQDDRAEERRRLRRLMNNLPGAAYRCRNDKDWTMEFISGGVTALTGYSPAMIQNNRKVSYNDIVHPDDQELVRLAVEEGHKNKRPFEVTYRITTRSGSTRWIWERGVFLDDGSVPEILEGFLCDVTESVLGEADLVASERRYQKLFESMITGYVRLRVVRDKKGAAKDFVIREVNPAFVALVGIEREALNGKLLRDVFGSVEETWSSVLLRVCDGGAPEHLTAYSQYLDRYLETMAYRVADDDMCVILQDVTERTLIEERIRKSEEQLRAMAEKMPVMLFAFDDNECLCFWNKESEHVTGYSAEELVGKPNALEVLGIDAAHRRAMLHGVETGEAAYREQEWEIVTRAGESRTIAWSNVSSDAPVRGWKSWGTGIDVTERLAALRALEAGKKRLKEAQRIAGVGDFSYNIETGETYWSPQMFVNYGWPADQAPPTGTAWLQGVHEDDRRLLVAAIGRARRDPKPIDITYRYHPANQAVRYLRARAELVRDPAGKGDTLHGTVQDITKMEEASRALEESRETLELAIGGTGAGSWDIQFDPKNSFTVTSFYLSPRAMALIGYEDDACDITMEEWIELIYPEDLEKVSAYVLEEFSAGKEEYKFEFRIRHRDGILRWLMVHGKLARKDKNTPLRWTGLLWDETERKKIEHELAQSRARLDSIMRSAPVGISLVQGRTILWVSQAFSDMLGREVADLVGHDTREFYANEAEHARVGQALYAQLDKQNVASTETDLYRPDGTPCRVLLRATRFNPDEEDSPVTVTALNISDLEAARAAQMQSEARYRHLFNAAHDAIFLLEDRKVVDLNAEAINFLERSKEEILGRSPLEFAPEFQDDGLRSQAVADDRMTRAESADRQAFEWNYLVPDAQLRHAEISLSRLEEPFANCLLIIARDTTQRKTAEARMRQLTLAISQSPVCVIVSDADGHIEYVNPRFEETTGWTLREVVGKNPRFLNARQSPARTYRDLWEQISRGKIWRGDFQNRRKDGSVYHVSATIAPLRDELGRITHYVGIQEDVTEQRDAERRQEELEKQFRQAQKMEAIGTLAGGIAHDFNNILAAILGYSELSLMTLEPGGDTYSDLESIHQAGLRARDLVQQILTFSRLSEHSRHPIRVDLIFKESLKLLRSANSSSVEIRQEFKDITETVMADSTQMHQLVLNLGTNAFQAIGEQVGTVTVACHACELDDATLEANPEMSPGRYVCLRVSDTGCGIGPEVLDRIYDPFFTTKEQGKGTGLGLATTHGIVTAHGGCIVVSSTVGVGTTFTVYLPCVEEEAILEDTLAVEIPRGTENILVVDDESALVKLTIRRLKSLGYHATGCDNSTDACKLFSEEPAGFDLILTDQQMPEMNGIELAQACWKLRPEIPVIVTSGYSEVLTHERAVGFGFAAFLPKPVALSDLACHVRAALDAKRA